MKWGDEVDRVVQARYLDEPLPRWVGSGLLMLAGVLLGILLMVFIGDQQRRNREALGYEKSDIECLDVVGRILR